MKISLVVVFFLYSFGVLLSYSNTKIHFCRSTMPTFPKYGSYGPVSAGQEFWLFCVAFFKWRFCKNQTMKDRIKIYFREFRQICILSQFLSQEKRCICTPIIAFFLVCKRSIIRSGLLTFGPLDIFFRPEYSAFFMTKQTCSQ